ncbi:MAG: hypothetical protein QXR58_02780, partial [Candidatus Micrarchaeaceae archaeon]
LNIVTQYTIREMLTKAYFTGIALGLGLNAYDTGIADKLVAKAAREAAALGVVGSQSGEAQ